MSKCFKDKSSYKTFIPPPKQTDKQTNKQIQEDKTKQKTKSVHWPLNPCTCLEHMKKKEWKKEMDWYWVWGGAISFISSRENG